ncbi:MAG TPA: hypothetical protein VGR52_05380 [Stellaceae bacterium]|nr:hypothetical protein [Stellaceae bacterium]HEV2204989.1 hypothetical protein [Candidatus Acidoferrales bacterium]
MAKEIGYCIYCGKRPPEVKLAKEHIVPFSLNADVYLKNASCISCADITKKFELHVARNIFGHYRIHRGVQTGQPWERPDELETRVIIRGQEYRPNLAIKDHPYFLMMPVWKQPQILRQQKPTDSYDKLTTHLYWYIPDNIKDTLQLADGEFAEIKPGGCIDANQFGRALAKIAYCNAIATLQNGLDDFDPLDLPKLILGEYLFIPFFVGSTLTLPPPPNKKGVEHIIGLDIKWVFDARIHIWRRMYVSHIRLFAQCGTKQHGLPIYTVVVGIPKERPTQPHRLEEHPRRNRDKKISSARRDRPTQRRQATDQGVPFSHKDGARDAQSPHHA